MAFRLPAAFPSEALTLDLEKSDSYTTQLHLHPREPAPLAPPPPAAPAPTRRDLATIPVLGRHTSAAPSIASVPAPPPYAASASVSGKDSCSLSSAVGPVSPTVSYVDDLEEWESLAPSTSLGAQGSMAPHGRPAGPVAPLTFCVVPNPRPSLSSASTCSDRPKHDAKPAGKSLLRKLTGNGSDGRPRSASPSPSPSPTRQWQWSTELRSSSSSRPLAVIRKSAEEKNGPFDITVAAPPAQATQAGASVPGRHVAHLAKSLKTRKLHFTTPWGDWMWKGVLHGSIYLRPVNPDKNGKHPTYAFINFGVNASARIEIWRACPDVVLAVASAYPLIQARREQFDTRYTSQARIDELNSDLGVDRWEAFIASKFVHKAAVEPKAGPAQAMPQTPTTVIPNASTSSQTHSTNYDPAPLADAPKIPLTAVAMPATAPPTATPTLQEDLANTSHITSPPCHRTKPADPAPSFYRATDCSPSSPPARPLCPPRRDSARTEVGSLPPLEDPTESHPPFTENQSPYPQLDGGGNPVGPAMRASSSLSYREGTGRPIVRRKPVPV